MSFPRYFPGTERTRHEKRASFRRRNVPLEILRVASYAKQRERFLHCASGKRSFFMPGIDLMWSTRLYALILLLLVGVSAMVLSVPASAQNTGHGNDPEQVKADLQNILNGSEFQAAPPADVSIIEKAAKWLREMWEKLAERFRDMFKFGDGGISKSPGVQWLFIALFIAGGTYLAYRLIRSYLANRTTKQAKSRTAFDLDDTEDDISREPNDWLQEAERQRTEGDFRRAYRAMFLAILLKLDQAGIVLFERGRTNGEYLRVLRRADRNDLPAFLSPLVLEFDLRWYGEKPTTAEDAAEMRVQYDNLSEMLTQKSNKTAETVTNAAVMTPEQA